MKTQIAFSLRTTAIACALAFAIPSHVSAVVSDLLEQGIYAEETKGDIDEAITLYRKALAESKASQSAAAQALFRLGQCYLKKNRTADAAAAFQKVVDDFPDEKDLVAKAKEFLPAKVTLLPVPWKDGERLTLDCELPTGLDVGVSIYHADLVKENGVQAWRVGTRVDAGGAQSYSRVDVEPESFRPLTSRWMHALLGDVTAVYGADGVSLQRVGETDAKKVSLSSPVFDNEEIVHLLRRLPLAVGYKTTLPCFVSFSGATIPLGVEVTATESVKVKAGEFDCFKVQLSIAQTFWYTTDAQRLLVKFEAGGAIVKLASVSYFKPGEPAVFDDSELGVKLSAPAGWAFHQHSDGKWKAEIVDILDPEGAIDAARLKLTPLSAVNAAQKVSPRALADSATAEMCGSLKEAQVDAGSWKNLLVHGRQAVSCVINYTDKKKDMAAYSVFCLGATNAEQFSMMIERDKLETARPAFDAIIASFRRSR